MQMLRVPALIVALAAFARGCLASELQPAKCNVLYPPYVIVEEETQYVPDPSGEGAWEARMFAHKAANGEESLDFGRITVHPGQRLPIHRHLDADEWFYCLYGEGEYTYWPEEQPERVVQPMRQGLVIFNPRGVLHEVYNNGSEALMLLAISPAHGRVEQLDAWPDSPTGGEGVVPAVLPWEASCAPGHGPDDGGQGVEWAEGAPDAEWQGEAETEASEEPYAGGDEAAAERSEEL